MGRRHPPHQRLFNIAPPNIAGDVGRDDIGGSHSSSLGIAEGIVFSNERMMNRRLQKLRYAFLALALSAIAGDTFPSSSLPSHFISAKSFSFVWQVDLLPLRGAVIYFLRVSASPWSKMYDMRPGFQAYGSALTGPGNLLSAAYHQGR